MGLADQLRALITAATDPETARTIRTMGIADPVEGNSAHCARDIGHPGNRETCPDGWHEDAKFVYEERLAIAEDLELDISPGSPAEQVAQREGRRLAAGLAPLWWPSRGRHVADVAIEKFRLPPGGLAPTGTPQHASLDGLQAPTTNEGST
jgi:hypothetical protein